MKQIRWILLGIVALAILIFSLSNPYTIPVNVFGKVMYSNLLTMLEMPFVFGFLIGAIFVFFKDHTGHPKPARA